MEVEADIQVVKAAVKLERNKNPFALAIVVDTWGSSPRQVGSAMLIEDNGHIVGSVSGGCVEGEVFHAALGAMETGKAQVLNFGVADEVAWSAGLSCGGEISVFVCSYHGFQKIFLVR